MRFLKSRSRFSPTGCGLSEDGFPDRRCLHAEEYEYLAQPWLHGTTNRVVEIDSGLLRIRQPVAWIGHQRHLQHFAFSTPVPDSPDNGGAEPEDPERDEFDLVRRKHRHEAADEGGILFAPALIEDDGVDVKADGTAAITQSPSRLKSAALWGGSMLLVADEGVRVDPPGTEDIAGNLVPEEIVDPVGFCLQLQLHIRVAAGEIEQGVEEPVAVTPDQRVGHVTRADMVEALRVQLDFRESLGQVGGEFHRFSHGRVDVAEAAAQSTASHRFDDMQLAAVGFAGEVGAEGEDLGGCGALLKQGLGSCQSPQRFRRVDLLLGPQLLHVRCEPVEKPLFGVVRAPGSLRFPVGPQGSQRRLSPHFQIPCRVGQLLDVMKVEVVFGSEILEKRLILCLQGREQGVPVNALAECGIHGDPSIEPWRAPKH